MISGVRISPILCGLEECSKNRISIGGSRRCNKRRILSCMVALTVQPTSPVLAFDWLEKKQLVERDPVEPFTIYGSIFKKYFIEQIVKGKIVSRKRGFTASACMNVLEESMETPALQAVPAGLKVTLIGEPCCAKGEGQSREDSCTPPCEKVCRATIQRHLNEVNERTGYVLDADDQGRVTNSCFNQCFKECLKPGKTISFILPFRPRR